MNQSRSNQSSIKFLATLLLFFCAALFLLAKAYEGAHPAFDWLRAFSEAAMVGALADWFAVTALFRHPLGVPIPHTAIIPKNQGRIGNTLGRFIYENFLTLETLAPRLKQARLGSRLASWLSHTENAKKISAQLRDLFVTILSTLRSGEITTFISKALPAISSQVKLGSLIAELAKASREADKDGAVFDEILLLSSQLLKQHNLIVRDLVSKELPWYIPSFVKNHLYGQVTDAITKTIVAMRADHQHPLRKQLSFLLDQALTSLETDPKWESRLQDGVRSISTGGSFLPYIEKVSGSLIDAIKRDEHRIFETTLTGVLVRLSNTLQQDEATSSKLEELFSSLILRLVNDYGSAAGDFVEQTVQSWDSNMLVSKIEQEVGRDLQFIRINGTIVGGLVGLTLHAINHFFKF